MSGGKIELVALTKRFAEIAVDNIDLTISSGEFFSRSARRAAARRPRCG